MTQLIGKTVWEFLPKLNTHLPHDSTIPLLDVYSREMNIYIHTKSCVGMFIAALFIITQNWN